MLDITDEIELQKKNGLNVGISLHLHQTAMPIGKHISQGLRKSVFSKIITQQSKLCIIIEEASTISNKSVLVVFLTLVILKIQ
jgi:DNA-directed RNA polymerase subunit E'/Rpb7